MAEKRKSHQKDASAKKAKTHKPPKKGSKSSSSSSSSHAHSSTEAARASIPYPTPIDGTGFIETTTRLTVTLAPIYSRDFWAGVHETLNSMLLHFVPQVRGVVLSYSKVKPLSDTALLFNDSPYGQLEVSARLLLWRPISGMSVNGCINVQSPDHIGLLLWDTFNASIPASFIPKDRYEWRPFDDDEIVARAASARQEEPSASEGHSTGEEEDGSEEEAHSAAADDQAASKDRDFSGSKFGSGEWVIKGTSQSIGTNGSLEFVIVDVIRANEVLSVTGALR